LRRRHQSISALNDGTRNFKETLENRDIPNAGAQAAQLQRRLDTDEFQAVYDADLPDDTRNALLDAQRDGDISAPETARAAQSLDGSDTSDVRQAIRDLDESQQRKAYEVIGETGEDGADFIDETPEADLQALFGQIDSDPDLSSGDLARLVRSTDGKAPELLDGISPGEYSDLMRLKGSNQRLTKEILIDGEINGKSRFVDDSVDGYEVVRIARNFERGRYEGPDGETLDFQDVRVIGEQPNGKGMFMPEQSVDHAFERHVLGDKIATRDTTSLFPTER
jgi:hypothetical protein